ncbi:MAG: sulfatase, partial [Luteolibacter sp.]
LANEGALFRANFCANSICSPSRATVLTGKHSHLNGVTKWQRFDGSQFTFPKALHASGYTTALYGKWHLGSDPTGFDDWAIYPGQGSYYNPDYLTPGGKKRVQGYSVDLTTEMSIDFMKRSRDSGKPFLLMCQFKAPHRTWQPGPSELSLYRNARFAEPENLFDNYQGRAGPAAKHLMGIGKHMRMDYDLKYPIEQIFERNRMTPQQFQSLADTYRTENDQFAANPPQGQDLVRWKYQRYLRDYLRCIAAIDRNVGRLLDYLDEADLAKDTIVVYSSDQGFFLGEHGWFDKRWMYEESFRMPLMIRWPKVVQPGTRIDRLTQNIDFAPTFLTAAGLDVPSEVQGRSLLPLMRSGKDRVEDTSRWRDSIYYHYYDGPGEHGVAKHYGIRTERYKLIRYYSDRDDTWELFDLKEDPQEMKSLYDNPDFREIREKLKKRLDELKASYQNRIFTEADEAGL